MPSSDIFCESSYLVLQKQKKQSFQNIFYCKIALFAENNALNLYFCVLCFRSIPLVKKVTEQSRVKEIKFNLFLIMKCFDW